MVASWSQHKLLNGILLPQFLEAQGIEGTKENVLGAKEIFKKYLDVYSTSLLSEERMRKFIEAFFMICAREFGVELPNEFRDKTMTEILNQTNTDYER